MNKTTNKEIATEPDYFDVGVENNKLLLYIETRKQEKEARKILGQIPIHDGFAVEIKYRKD